MGASRERLKIISWNTGHRPSKAVAQAEALLDRKPDIVALQEGIPSTEAILAERLSSGGLSNIRVSVRGANSGARSYAVLVASRLALERTEQLSLPWEEKSLSVLVACHGYTLELHSVHVSPGSTNGWVKVECLEAVLQRLARPSSHRRLLCGDFNARQLELCDGRVVTWAQQVGINSEIRTRGRFRGGAGARWDAAERNVCLGLAEYDLRDVFRDLHGYGREAYSWVLERGGKEVRRRFEHVFASAAFQTVSCEYLQESRQSGLSDHAPVEVHFERAA